MGHGQALRHRRHTQLGITTTRHQRTNPVTQLEASALQGGRITTLDHAGHFQARNIRSAGWNRVMAQSL